MSKYGVISGPYFPVFGLNTEIYFGPEITPYLDNFDAVIVIVLTICLGIGTYFGYKYMNPWYLKNDVARIKFGTRTRATI